MSTVITNCDYIKVKINSIISNVESAEDKLRSCKSSLSDGVVLSGTSLSGDTLDNVLMRLSNVKSQANNLYNKCNTIISQEKSKSSDGGSSSGGGGGGSGSLPRRGTGSNKEMIAID